MFVDCCCGVEMAIVPVAAETAMIVVVDFDFDCTTKMMNYFPLRGDGIHDELLLLFPGLSVRTPIMASPRSLPTPPQ